MEQTKKPGDRQEKHIKCSEAFLHKVQEDWRETELTW